MCIHSTVINVVHPNPGTSPPSRPSECTPPGCPLLRVYEKKHFLLCFLMRDICLCCTSSTCCCIYLPGLIPRSILLPEPGRYMTLPDLDRELAMSLAASIRLSSIKPGPATFVASEMSRADSLSPSARMTAAFLSCTRQGPTSADNSQDQIQL